MPSSMRSVAVACRAPMLVGLLVALACPLVAEDGYVVKSEEDAGSSRISAARRKAALLRVRRLRGSSTEAEEPAAVEDDSGGAVSADMTAREEAERARAREEAERLLAARERAAARKAQKDEKRERREAREAQEEADRLAARKAREREKEERKAREAQEKADRLAAREAREREKEEREAREEAERLAARERAARERAAKLAAARARAENDREEGSSTKTDRGEPDRWVLPSNKIAEEEGGDYLKRARFFWDRGDLEGAHEILLARVANNPRDWVARTYLAKIEAELRRLGRMGRKSSSMRARDYREPEVAPYPVVEPTTDPFAAERPKTVGARRDPVVPDSPVVAPVEDQPPVAPSPPSPAVEEQPSSTETAKERAATWAREVEIDARIAQARDIYRKGHFDAARVSLLAILADDPRNEEARGLLAEARRALESEELPAEVARERRIDEATKIASAERRERERAMAEARTAMIEARLTRGLDHYENGHFQEAQKDFITVLTEDQENVLAREYLGKTVAALAGGEATPEPAKTDASAEKMYAIAKSLADEGHYEAAERILIDMLKDHSDHKQGWALFREVREQLRKQPAAETGPAVEPPVDPRPFENAVVVGKADGAADDLVTQAYKTGCELYYENRRDEARSIFLKVLDMDPTHSGAKKYIALIDAQ